jgi:hypothetical protein
MLTLAQSLSYYKRKDVQRLILEHIQDKEIAIRYNESFGKRPDTLTYENDILESAKRGATSFHCSEELWNNPLQLNPALRKSEIDELRKGWDLILDIDCPYWPLAKIMTYLFIKSLKDHKINAVTVKFSGGKGFHIGVPFEAFPSYIATFDQEKKTTLNIAIKDWFPDGPRKVASYLLDYIQRNLIVTDHDAAKISFGKINISYDKFLQITGKTGDDLLVKECKKCKNIITTIPENVYEYICPHCETSLKEGKKDLMLCPKCKHIMERKKIEKTLCSCGSNQYTERVDLRKIVDVDTVLISVRHMYRMPYSLHEKTGLVSQPFSINHILKFEKDEASTNHVKKYKFLDREETKPGEATELFQKAFDFTGQRDSKKDYAPDNKEKRTYSDNLENAQAIPEEYFPPCIKKISAGLEDGKKRALLVLINFLSACNWPHEKIEEYVIKWNEKNYPDKLKDTYIKGQLRYQKSQKEKLLPPNCDNKGYMIDTQFCVPDEFCRRIKNPAQYAKKKIYFANSAKPKRRKKEEKELTFEQKEDKKTK